MPRSRHVKNGLEAVLLQEDKPDAYASRSMTPAKLNYEIIERNYKQLFSHVTVDVTQS